MTHEYATAGRAPLDPDLFGARYDFTYAVVSGSTQSEAKDLLDRGRSTPLVVVAEEQTAGRGRLDRSWTAPRYSSILMSIALPVASPPDAFTLRVGVVVAEVLLAHGVDVRVKWPNDVVVMHAGRLRKLGGILAELHRDHPVVGVGINIDLSDAELPTPDAISCRQLGIMPQRESVIRAIVDGVVAIADGSLDRYRALSSTLGSEVSVTRLTGDQLVGRALDVDGAGALIVRDDHGVEHRVTVGDVQQARPSGAA